MKNNRGRKYRASVLLRDLESHYSSAITKEFQIQLVAFDWVYESIWKLFDKIFEEKKINPYCFQKLFSIPILTELKKLYLGKY